MTEKIDSGAIMQMAADIVAAYVSTNAIAAAEVPGLIDTVSTALRGVHERSLNPPQEKPTPAVPVKKSVTPDHIVCLEDGKKFKSLKGHLKAHHGMTPEEYREKWGLPYDYPMVAPNYSAARKAFAKKIGLGRKRR